MPRYFDPELIKLVRKHYNFSKEEAEIYVNSFSDPEKLKQSIKTDMKKLGEL